MHSESDEELLQRIRVGDKRAFTSLYERYKRTLYGYCLKLLCNESWAEDAVHDTFLKIYTGAVSVENPQSFRMWIFRVARNEALMTLRGKKNKAGIDADELPGDETPFDIVSRKETTELVNDLLGQLSCAYREVIVLRELEQLSYSEIAGLTGTTVSSVKSRIFKARKALATRIAVLRPNGRSDI